MLLISNFLRIGSSYLESDTGFSSTAQKSPDDTAVFLKTFHQ